MPDSLTIRPAAADEMPLVLEFIRELAVHERLEGCARLRAPRA
jgi:hypothetical protein